MDKPFTPEDLEKLIRTVKDQPNPLLEPTVLPVTPEMSKVLQKKFKGLAPGYYPGFSPAHSYAYAHMTVMTAMLKAKFVVETEIAIEELKKGR